MMQGFFFRKVETVNNKVLLALTGILSGAAGLLAGILVRQPEINKLHKLVKRLQKEIDRLEQAVEEQNDEITALMLKYKALKIYQFGQRKELKESIQDELVFQYATADYLNLLLDYVNADIEMSKEDLRFYEAYGKMIAEKPIDFKEKQFIKEYVRGRHTTEITRLKQCDAQPVLDNKSSLAVSRCR